VNAVTSRPGRRRPFPRDQDETAFSQILAELVSATPGAKAAALVDMEGEAVDYWGYLPPFDVKVAAAHWRVVIDELRARPGLSQATQLTVRAARGSFQVHVLPEGYALVLMLARAAGFVGGSRAVAACSLALAREASWSWKGLRRPHDWHRAAVAIDESGRPLSIGLGPRSTPLEILGAVASGLQPRERAWRVRLASGLEATLVRERGNRWYVDDSQAVGRGDVQPNQQRR
jgi:hypothetical protein